MSVPVEVNHPEHSVGKSRFLLAHGAGGDRNSAGLKALATGLAKSGHLVLRPDLPYRAAGRRSPPRAEASVEGFAQICGQAREKFGCGPWLVGGRSYGGRVATMAVAEGMEADGLLLYSYPLHRPGDPSQPRVAHWPRIRVPSLFLEGTNDPFCDLEVFHRHLGVLGGPVTVHLVEGGDHSLRVSGARSPEGKPQSEAAVAESLVPVIEGWVQMLQAP